MTTNWDSVEEGYVIPHTSGGEDYIYKIVDESNDGDERAVICGIFTSEETARRAFNSIQGPYDLNIDDRDWIGDYDLCSVVLFKERQGFQLAAYGYALQHKRFEKIFDDDNDNYYWEEV